MRQYEPAQKGRKFSPIPPNKVAPVFGHTNDSIMNLGSIMKGVGEGALSTISGLHDMGTAVEGMVGLKPNAGEQELTQKVDKAAVAKTPDEQLGKGIETGLELGVGAGKSLASAGSGLLEKTGIKGIFDKFAQRKTVQALTPKMTTGEMEAAKSVVKPRIGAPGVDMTKDKKFMEMVQDTHGIVKNKSSIEDKNALQGAIKNTSEGLKSFFQRNNVPTYFGNLIKKLELVNPSQSLKSDPTAFKTYSRVRSEVQDSIYSAMKGKAKGSGDFKSMTDPNDFWDAMKILDNKAEQELGDKVFGTPEYTGVKTAIQDMRQALMQYARDSLKFPGQMEQVNKMQEFIQVARGRGIEINNEDQAMQLMKQMGITNTSEDVARSAFLEDAMSKMSNYYKAIDNVSTKVPDEIRAGSTFGKRHPLIKSATKGAATVVGGGAAYEVGKEAGVPLP